MSNGGAFRGYRFLCPTEIIHGPGVAAGVGTVARSLGWKRAFVVTDRGVVDVGLLEPVTQSLSKEGIGFEIFDRVLPDPTDSFVDELAGLLAASGCDFVVAVGGGSAIDSAKAADLIATNGGRAVEYIRGTRTPQKELLPLAAIPTTSGTGSEVTKVSVVTDTERKFKKGIGHPLLHPRLAFIDPELKKTMPPFLAAGTGMDALTHAIEAYTAKLANPVSDALALGAIEMIGANLRKAVSPDRTIEAVDKVGIASTIAGMAFTNSSTTLVHALSQPAGAHFGVPHGIGNAVFLPLVMEFNLTSAPARFRDVARALGVKVEGMTDIEAGKIGISIVRDLLADTGIPQKLGPLGVKVEGIEQMADGTFETKVPVAANPREVRREDVIELYLKAI